MDFSEHEKVLLKCITNMHLLNSISEIRQAAMNIWDPQTPRIIKDYTDHGAKHSERLAYYASKLLEANVGRPLSEKETYLLLASIYLHDIGMQCDLANHLCVKEKSEKLGAKFICPFASKSSSDFSITEQKAIRENHNYISAAWIHCSYLDGDGVLGHAVQTIPEELVSDLMDICMYHSRLPIKNCPITIKFENGGRKQLIAALLRFSDELDIENVRVDINVINEFRLPPLNSVYWWIHNNTKIDFIARNTILLIIKLNPENEKEVGHLVNDIFINEFQSKTNHY